VQQKLALIIVLITILKILIIIDINKSLSDFNDVMRVGFVSYLFIIVEFYYNTLASMTE